MTTVSEFYNGNPNIKKAGIEQELTPDQLEELMKCAEDPIYFISTYCKIITLDKGLQLFKPFEFQKRMVESFYSHRFVINKLPRQMGKLLPNDEVLATPTGFKQMGDMQVGDQVIDETGRACNVVFVSKEQNVPAYRITFDDGSTVVACEDHQWTVFDRLNQKRTQKDGKIISNKHREITTTTKKLAESNWKRVNKRGYSEYAYYIPNTDPVEFASKDVVIDPYILGLWLGDGTSRSTDLTCLTEHKNFYELQGVTFRHPHSRERNPNVFTQAMTNFTRDDLRSYGLLKTEKDAPTKHIPSDYLFNSVNVRLGVLQGLMDTDGFIEKNGMCAVQLTNNNIRLIDNVYTLLCSLGLKVGKQIHNKTNSTRLTFSVGRDKFDVCRIPHKLDRQKKQLPRARYAYSRTIVNIEPLENNITGRCIQVDSAKNLYLCTKSFIPTHNTTAVAGFLLHYALFSPDKTVGILANKAKTAREILARIKRMYEYLPKWMQPGVITWNKGDIELGNGSVFLAESTSDDSIRGFSLNIVYLDEFAHVEHQIDFWESTYPVISSGDTTKVIITSTPNGLDLFYKIFKDAENKRNEFHAIDVHWSEHPKRDEKWKQTTLSNIGEEQFQQEFECEFMGSSGTLINGNTLKKLVYQDPIAIGEGIKQYAEPKKDHKYAIVADTSHGKGLDYSAFHVIDITAMPYEQVFVYRNNLITPHEYAEIIFSVSRLYNRAAVLCETNDMGQTVADTLFFDFECDSQLYTKSAGRAGKKITGGWGDKAERGVRTTTTVKSVGCSLAKLLIEQFQLIINDFDTITELARFSKKGSSYEAEQGATDDLVMGLVLFAWLSDQQYFRELTDINTLHQLRDNSEEQMMNKLTPFGIIDRGEELDNGDGSIDNPIEVRPGGGKTFEQLLME